ncbi:MFS transporter [Parvibaculum sp.]|jgi:MFS family permease|uniref:MFS transporter n=2 Tax=Parvibaculum sp. TaxID=2024848 RepID=UPI002FDB21C1
MTDIPKDEDTTLALFRLRDFRFYISGRFLGTLGMLIQSVAVGWQVYDITESPLALGYVGLAQFLPMVLMTLPAGDIADRIDRRYIVAGAGLLEAAAAGWLILLTLTHTGDVTWFYAALALFGSARALMAPASRSFVPLLVSPLQLPRAIAVSSSTFQVAVITGPAIGGGLYLFGPVFVYSVCVALFLTVTLAFFAIRTRPPVQTEALVTTAFQRVTAGISYMRRTPIVLGAVSLDLFAVLLGGAVALLPIYARDILHVGPEGLGVMRSAPAVGAIVINLLIIWRPIRARTGHIMFACVALFGIATIVFGLSENFWLTLAALAVMGASDMVSVNIRSTLIPLATPRQMLGRVTAVEMLFIGASNELGEFESGVTAAWFGTVPAVVIGGLGTLGVVGIWMWLFPDLRKVDKLSDVKPQT